jgi:hypothetical protein
MFELMAKYKVPGIANGESRASSVILFEQSEAGGKKRLERVKEKSVASSRNGLGKF